MRTNARIIVDTGGVFRSSYVHYDGHHILPILRKHYNTPEKAQELIELGDLSSLGKKVAPEKGTQHTFNNPCSGVTVAYHRDRGEKYTNYYATSVDVLLRKAREPYVYFYDKEDGWIPVRPAFK
jgi:hypothetical protein